MLTLDAALGEDLRKIMFGRGLATEEETLRTVVQEAAQAMEAAARERRGKAIEEAYGSWVGKGLDLPRKDDEIHQGMPRCGSTPTSFP